MKKISTIIVFLAFLSGCSSVSQGGYYWGDYSSTYFSLVKDRNADTVSRRVVALEDIVSKSADRDIRVPPGIHAELGMLYAEEGREAEGFAQFEREVALYPEAKPFIERLIARKQP